MKDTILKIKLIKNKIGTLVNFFHIKNQIVSVSNKNNIYIYIYNGLLHFIFWYIMLYLGQSVFNINHLWQQIFYSWDC